METDKALYNQYQNEIPDYETFKAIKSKKLKSLLFTGWVAQFGSKEIRKRMGINYSTYGYLLKYVGPNAVEKEKKPMGRPRKEVIEVEGYSVPDERNNPFQIEPTQSLAVVEKKEPVEKEPVEALQVVKTPFVSVDWTNTPELIKNQLEAIANVLLFEKGEITVKLEVFKNN